MVKPHNKLLAIFLFSFLFMSQIISAQNNEPYVRIARITVDSSQLENYKAALKEEIETAVRVEPGVLRMYAVYERDNPNHITVFETYASKEAYQLHLQSSHFKKYKTGTLNMVKSLELIDAVPIVFDAKPKM